MADKKKLTTSFGTSRKRTKPSLAEIDKIAETTSGTSTASSTSTAPAAAPNPESPTKTTTKSTGGIKKKPAAKRNATVAKKPAPEPPAEPEPVPMKKTSIDIPLELYQEMKIHLIKNQTKFREYLTDLIEKDLKKHRK